MRCTETSARGQDASRSTTILRLVWSQLWQHAVDAGIRIGCPNHEAFWRREYLYARSVTLAGGTAQIQRNVLADRVLALPR
jgi:alkylation response protein AidB-like acyl-CoA dehydrogenase